MPATVYLVTGGARSGKSSYAERLCQDLCPTPVYLATSGTTVSSHDADFGRRIQKHQEARAEQSWTTIEEPLKPSKHAEAFSRKVVLVDCLTMWLTNVMMEQGAFEIDKSGVDTRADETVTQAVEKSLSIIQEEFDALIQPWHTTFVVVTNEVGSGTHGSSHLTRKFVDAQGWFNQYVAKKANKVIHMVCGIPNVIQDDDDDRLVQGNNLSAKNPANRSMIDRFLSARKINMDSNGYFMLKVNYEESLIVATFHSCMKNDKGEICDLNGVKIPCCEGKGPLPFKTWRCRTAKELTVQIFEDWGEASKLVSVGHAAYIGREAQKAEESLNSTRFGRKGRYQQD